LSADFLPNPSSLSNLILHKFDLGRLECCLVVVAVGLEFFRSSILSKKLTRHLEGDNATTPTCEPETGMT
jgi:hypothetical protein